MHSSKLLQDKVLGGRPTPTVYQYLKECKSIVAEIERKRRDNQITNEQKYDQIAELMQRLNDIMDLCGYNPETVPTRLGAFFSHGDFEGAMAKSAAERGAFHSWGQIMAKNAYVNKQVEWYSDRSWFSRFQQRK